MSRVVVIGGGVIGLSCAYHAARRGHQVVVLERDRPGRACSSGNMGWLVPSLSQPLPGPGVVWESFKWMFKRDSPLYVDPRFVVAAPGWLWRFWRHCNSRDFERGLEAVVSLSSSTVALYDQLRADGVQFELHHAGLLFLFLTTGALHSSIDSFDRLAALGLPSATRLSRGGVMMMEPTLSSRVSGGVLMSSEGHVRPETLCAGLVDALYKLGATIETGVEVTAVDRKGANKVTRVRSSSGAFEGDVFVIAAGAWSGRVARLFGLRLPIEAGKGYSVTISPAPNGPSRPLYLYEPRVGVSPFDGALRLGGTMELSGLNTRIIPARVAAIQRAAADFLSHSQTGTAQVEWTGMRPLTPDGLPVIGRAPGWENLYIATGHSMLGVTLAAVTGRAIAELLTDGSSSVGLEPFDAARFS